MKFDKLKLISLIIYIVVLSIAYIYRDHLSLETLKTTIKASGYWGPVIFIAGYALFTILFIPGAATTLLGGVLFGPLWGTLYNLTGATIGATLAFLLARYVFSELIYSKVHGQAKKIAEAINDEGWKAVAFVRLVPLLPFNLVNYLFGVTKIKLSHYIVASYIFMIPGSFTYTYLGYAGDQAIQGSGDWVKSVMTAASLLLALFLFAHFVKKYKKV